MDLLLILSSRLFSLALQEPLELLPGEGTVWSRVFLDKLSHFGAVKALLALDFKRELSFELNFLAWCQDALLVDGDGGSGDNGLLGGLSELGGLALCWWLVFLEGSVVGGVIRAVLLRVGR